MPRLPPKEVAEWQKEIKFIESEEAKKQYAPRFARRERGIAQIEGEGGAEAIAIIRSVPAAAWEFETINGTICAKRIVDVIEENVKTKEKQVLYQEEEKKCVSLPTTKRCYEEIKPAETCDKVKFTFACADETSGMLTVRQVGAVTNLPREEIQKCFEDLKGQNLIVRSEDIDDVWGGERYFIMRKKTRDEFHPKS